MIITITDKNAHLYNALFAKAYQDCKDHNKLQPFEENSEGRFLSLNDYFAHMGDLISFNKPEYLMLPLDEEPFSVNANLRTINAQRLVTVQNDQIAETVIFMIDRYYDYMDLCNATIYVQWTLPDGKEGATQIELIDADFEPGKIRFGWPLDNEITSQVGQVKYSIRFWVKNETNDKVVYSFNTLSSSITISPALQVEINDSVDVNKPVAENIFSKAIRNSSIISQGIPLPLNPTFAEPGLDLPISASLNEKDTLTLKAQAITSDTGSISYEWYYQPAVTEMIGDKEFSSEKSYPYNDIVTIDGEIIPGFKAYGGTVDNNVFEEITDLKELIPGEFYYTRQGTETPYSYIAYTGTTIPTDGTKLYQRFTTYTVPAAPKKVTGRYMVKAVNTITPNTSNAVASQECSLISPSDVEYKTDLVSSIIIEGSGTPVNISVKEQSNGATMSYKWYKDVETSNMSNGTIIAKASNPNLTIITPGWYKAVSTASLNREDKSKDSNICKATFSPALPTVTYTEDIAEDLEVDEIPIFSTPGDVTLTAIISNIIPSEYSEYDSKLFSEELQYKWTIKLTNQDTERELTQSDVDDGFVKSGLGTNEIVVVNGSEITSYVISCYVTNILNGKSVTADKPLSFAVV